MGFLKQNECIKIGRKDINVYYFVAGLNLAKYGSIELSARGTNTFTCERLCSLFKKIGIEEVKREDVIEDEQPTLKVTLKVRGNHETD